ncbi:unnamed protein product, partial [Mesorhabditis belari]|uniref:Glypican-6 n=1 Tax=Mesorhabditis belari TaxID=2138241 RepID=A0AAF3EF82_9BILA
MELRIRHNDARAFRGAVEDRVIVLRHLLHSNLERMRTHFLSSLSTCHTHLDTMFNRTYGRYYQQNREIFSKFFRQLQSFSSPHSVMPVELMVDNLFEELYITLYQLLNPLKKVTPEVQRCMKETMEEMRPFAEVPNRLQDGLRRGLEGWRALLAHLDEAHSILGVFLNTTLPDQCQTGLARMGDCSLCSQSEPTKPCLNMCLNVAKGCLAEWAEVDQQWDQLVGSLSRLISSLGGPHSLQSAFNPLPVQISEAIMTFQDKGATLTNKVLATCFTLDEVDTNENQKRNFYRGKREVNGNVKNGMEMRRVNGNPLERSKRAVWLRHVQEQADGSWRMLQQIINAFKEKLTLTRGFFKKLPNDLCDEPQFSSSINEKCWTGKHIGNYNHEVVKDGTTAQRNNPEFLGKASFEYRGLFIDERLRLGMLAARVRTIAEQIAGKNFDNDLPELDEKRIDDEDESDEGELEEASGDGEDDHQPRSHKNKDRTRIQNIETNALEHTSASGYSRFSIFYILLALYFIRQLLSC